ncbi:type IV conjugative transfer system lipoprotein TraV (plasmid) [Burkholderia vietnamiensis]|uniref:Membrane lipoprotein lipid attachment site n=1 Tax=Burkholderia vietnamiensis (strain G4 / LMG 22486) TaxID=269482 RepID=A4JTP1_BURVG|nr:membrane lipoprotein lipid attachment site [Burkholderia vietnamiensis G4]MCB4350196.1 type IV conjugative transfer system lipoprotein TraV [Burkholderia vietnamiensis]
MNKRLLVASLLPLLATGCSSVFNTADNDSFSCPGMPQGIICKTPMAVYKSTNHMPAPTDNDTPYGPNVKQVGVKFGDDQGNVVRPELAASAASSLPGLTPVSATASARPVRTPAQVMRIWIAPWIDSKDDLHYPSYLFTEVQPRRWSYGKTEFAGKGMVVPHRELVAVAPVQQQESMRQRGKPAAHELPDGDAQQVDTGLTAPKSADVSVPGMPSPSDINLD